VPKNEYEKSGSEYGSGRVGWRMKGRVGGLGLKGTFGNN
jgi:hypothetical protein